MKKLLIVLIGVLIIPHALRAAEPNPFRGGWVSEGGGPTQVLMLIVRGNAVTGTYCMSCEDPRNLGFVVDGRIDEGSVRFTIRYEAQAGKPIFDDVRGTVKDKELVLSVQPRKGAAHAISVTLHRPEALPPMPILTNDEAELPGLPPGKRAVYVLPGPPEPWTADKVFGLWLWGTGPGKQYFIIRQVGKELLGMVCGPCDNPNAMAPLDGFVIDGTDLTFNIVHEDTGAAVQHGPFNNVAHATLSHNEMHIKVIPSFDPPTARPIQMTLLGPVIFQSPSASDSK